jgi:hypothetical protein
MVGAVGVFAEPSMLTSVRGGKIVGPEEPELTKGELGLENEVLFVFIGG